MPLHWNKTCKFNSFRIILVLVLLSLTACSASETTSPGATSTPVSLETSSPVMTSTPRPTSTPTLPPLGKEGNPITIGFILTPEQTAAIEAAEDVAFRIKDSTGYTIESRIYPDFQSLSSAVLDDEVDLFWLEPLEYIYLKNMDAAQAILMTNHLGVYEYGVQFLANKDSGFQVYYDSETNQNTTNSSSVLQQFAGTRPCFINAESIPGYFLPMSLLAEASTPTLDPVFTYDYSAAIRALYIQGICDFGVTYTMTGDPFTASEILRDLPDAQEQVIVIWRSEGIIPNLNLSASPALPLDIRYKLEEAILNISKDPNGLILLNSSLEYDVGALKSIRDQIYDPLRNLLYLLELDLKEITGAAS